MRYALLLGADDPLETLLKAFLAYGTEICHQLEFTSQRGRDILSWLTRLMRQFSFVYNLSNNLHTPGIAWLTGRRYILPFSE